MAEATRPKYDNLPGIDTAPDIYETPELAEDVSTIQASTAVSESDDGDEDPEHSAIRHQRFQIDQARDRFQPSRVDAQDVDFSDNITAQGRSYRTSTRAGRRRAALEQDGEEDEETFSEKLLRLKKEILELEREYEKESQNGENNKVDDQDPRDALEAIANKIDSLYVAQSGGTNDSGARLNDTIERFKNYKPFEQSSQLSKAIANQPGVPGQQIQQGQLNDVLSHIGDIDEKIAQMEHSLGLDGSTMPELSNGPSFPIFTTLQRLEQTLGLIGDASSENLDSVTQQIKQLIADAERLKETRTDAARASTGLSDNNAAAYPDQEAKINALYGILPSIDKLSPVLPLVLERLRTLRLVHTSAWQADELLSELERRQGLQETEIKEWENQLHVLEKDMEASTAALQSNMKVVGDDVKALEGRIENLSSDTSG